MNIHGQVDQDKCIKVMDYRINGPWGQIRTSQWDFGQTYRVEFSIDGPAGIFGFGTSVLQGNDYVFQDFGEWPLPNPVNYSFRQVGMQNLLDGEFGGSLTINIDDFSFTPEPSTAILLIVGSLVALRHRRIKQT